MANKPPQRKLFGDLSKALRDNLIKRKAQQRSRKNQEAENNEGLHQNDSLETLIETEDASTNAKND